MSSRSHFISKIILASTALIILNAPSANAGLLDIFLEGQPSAPSSNPITPSPSNSQEPMEIGNSAARKPATKRPKKTSNASRITKADRDNLEALFKDGEIEPPKTAKPSKTALGAQEKRNTEREKEAAQAILSSIDIKFSYIRECRSKFESCTKKPSSKTCQKALIASLHTPESTDGRGTPRWQHIRSIQTSQNIANQMPIFRDDPDLKRALELSKDEARIQRNLIIFAKEAHSSYCDYVNKSPSDLLASPPEVSEAPKVVRRVHR